jgi:hypothetical protein
MIQKDNTNKENDKVNVGKYYHLQIVNKGHIRISVLFLKIIFKSETVF